MSSTFPQQKKKEKKEEDWKVHIIDYSKVELKNLIFFKAFLNQVSELNNQSGEINLKNI